MNDPLPLYVRYLKTKLAESQRERQVLIDRLETATRLALLLGRQRSLDRAQS